MRRLIVGVIVVLTMAFAPAAMGHPSENRADQSTFGGPHCHVNNKSGKLAFPSHQAHIKTGLEGRIFDAAACP